MNFSFMDTNFLQLFLLVALMEGLQEGPYPARGEIVDHQLFAALEWLENRGSRVPAPPLRFLRRAYRELLRKTSYLDPSQRPHFLMQIQPHREIVDAATRYGLSMPGFVCVRGRTWGRGGVRA